METVGGIFRTQREKKGLLLRQVAAFADIDQAILSKIERSERKPNKELLYKLSKILGLDKRDMLIHFVSEKIAYEIAGEKTASEILKVAETKVRYLKKNGKGKNAKYQK